jgi:hypothetical protein
MHIFSGCVIEIRWWVTWTDHISRRHGGGGGWQSYARNRKWLWEGMEWSHQSAASWAFWENPPTNLLEIPPKRKGEGRKNRIQKMGRHAALWEGRMETVAGKAQEVGAGGSVSDLVKGTFSRDFRPLVLFLSRLYLGPCFIPILKPFWICHDIRIRILFCAVAHSVESNFSEVPDPF